MSGQSAGEGAAARADSRPRPRRLWRRFALAAAGLVILLGATLDYWLPAIAQSRVPGLSVGGRETEFARSVTWRDVEWSGGGVRFRAGLVRVSAPWAILRAGKAGGAVEDWTLTIGPGGETKTEGPREAWGKWVPALREWGATMERRVDRWNLRNGRIVAAGEEIEVAMVELRGAGFRATTNWRGEEVQLVANLRETKGVVNWPRGDAVLDLQVSATAGEAGLRWAKNVATARAEFSPGDWLPARALVEGREWRVPAERLRLGRSAYEDLVAGFRLSLEGGEIAATVEGVARPKAPGMPELRIAAAGRASEAELSLERLEVVAPYLRARLSEPVAWKRAGGWSGVGEPVLAWEADLGAVTEGEVKGRVEGRARWVAAADAVRVRWEARGEKIAWREIADAHFEARGETDPERTRVAEAKVWTEDGSRMEARGDWVHATRVVEAASLRGELSGASLGSWMPAATKVERMAADLRVSGAWPGLSVEGKLSAKAVELSGWAAEAIEVSGKVDGLRAVEASFAMERGEARMRGRVAGDWRERLEGGLVVRRSDGRELSSTKLLAAGVGGAGVEADLAMAGEGGEVLAFAWRPAGPWRLSVRSFDSGWAADWRAGRPMPWFLVREAEIDLGPGADGWIAGRAAVDAEWRRAKGERLWARGRVALDAGGVKFDLVETGREDEALAEGGGIAPLRVSARNPREVAVVPGGRWDFRFTAKPGVAWWEDFAKAVDIAIEEPGLVFRVEGEAETPRARIDLSARRAELRGEGLPEGGLELRDLRASAELANDEIALRRLDATVEGQRFEAEGRVKLGAGDWRRLRARPYVWLRDNAEARVRLPGAQVAALARHLPTLLAPKGILEAELRLSPPAMIDGALRLRGAATRPLGGFGVVQDIEVDLALAGLDVRVETMRAMAGGQPLVVTGGARRVPGRMPLLDLAVRAERFPLVRRPGLLLRGDLDLTVKTNEAGLTRLGGEVKLRDSLFLADIRPLITPGGGRGPAAVRARPPYFSVQTPPLADWQLALRVGGERFIRLRTPVFEGVGSAQFELTGTLREPLATGEFRVGRGNILFPFASFAVQEGAVRLQPGDPFTPTLDFWATGRRLGYDLRLELTGTAESPQLQITSSPPLDAEEVLLMVTAGVAPESGAGSTSGTQRLAAFGAYVGRDLLRTLGFGGADEERLTISSGDRVSRAGRETFGFEFKLNERWSLTGEYDEFDAYNVGLKRSVRARPPGPGDSKEQEVADAP